MVLRVARPVRRPESKFPQARKVVPAEVRHILGRSEFKRSLRGTDDAENKRLHCQWLAEWEAQIAAAQAQREGKLRALTLREADQLADEWYRGRLDALGDDASTPDHWELERDLLSSLFLPQVDLAGC